MNKMRLVLAKESKFASAGTIARSLLKLGHLIDNSTPSPIDRRTRRQLQYFPAQKSDPKRYEIVHKELEQILHGNISQGTHGSTAVSQLSLYISGNYL